MAETEGQTSNPNLSELTALFETLADWEEQLQAQDIDFGELTP